MTTDAEIDAHLARCHARARHAWAVAAEPNAGPYVDNRREGDIDTAAENRKTEREYAAHLLQDREEAC